MTEKTLCGEESFKKLDLARELKMNGQSDFSEHLLFWKANTIYRTYIFIISPFNLIKSIHSLNPKMYKSTSSKSPEKVIR